MNEICQNLREALLDRADGRATPTQLGTALVRSMAATIRPRSRSTKSATSGTVSLAVVGEERLSTWRSPSRTAPGHERTTCCPEWRRCR